MTAISNHVKPYGPKRSRGPQSKQFGPARPPPPPTPTRPRAIIISLPPATAMATRALVTRLLKPAASSLRRRPDSWFLGPMRSQNDIVMRRFSSYVEDLRHLVEETKKKDQVLRRKIKWYRRGFKTVKWTCYTAVSATIYTTLISGKA